MLTGVDPEELPRRGIEIDVERAVAGRADQELVRTLRAMLASDPQRRASGDLVGENLSKDDP
jgi:hypothetical protein